ncbi:MAG: DNA translocase FtsK [Clostridia bacterium]|nr:DNA translocase FtsK [Clostridia bacterium]
MAAKTKASAQKRQITRNSTKTKNKTTPKTRTSRDKFVSSVILIAISVLLFFLILLPGEKAWYSLHSFILGIFDNFSVSLPVLLLYVTISDISSRPLCKVSTKVALAFVLVALMCTCNFIFSCASYIHFYDYFTALQNLFNSAKDGLGCGLLGGILGYPLVYFIGDLGSKIIIILSIAVVALILSLDLIIYIRQKYILYKKNAEQQQKESESKNAAKEERAAKQAMKRVEELRKKKNSRTNNIDIELDPDNDMPMHPVVSVLDREKTHTSPLEKLKKTLNDLNHPAKTAAEQNKEKPPAPDAPDENDIEDVKNVAKAFIEKTKNQKFKKEESSKISKNKSLVEEKTTDLKYNFPPLNLLEDTKILSSKTIQEELETNGLMLVDTLKSFGVQTKIIDISRGPAVTRFELQPAAGVKISKITSLADDIALNLAASGVRIEAPIPGKAAVGVEIPNKNVMIVRMKELISSKKFVASQSKLTAALGRDIAGNVTVADLAQMPHLLIAGSTGSGKSVCINSLIISLLYKASPDEVKFLMIDPKVVELGIYNDIPHLLVPVVTDASKAAGALSWAVTEMLKRYRIFAECGVRDLFSYNKFVKKVKDGKAEYIPKNENDTSPLELMPQIVIIIDELSDLMMAAPREVEDSICRLAQMARAAGMHLIIATQRPSVNVITGIIKANIPSRIAFAVSSQVDSRTILDMGGAETLLGRGDMLFSPIGTTKPRRIQGCFVTDEEIERITDFIKNNKNTQYDEQIIDQIERNAAMGNKSESDDDEEQDLDILFSDAAQCVIEAGQASTSMLQRKLRVGYARAGRLIDELEQNGVIGPHEGSKPRKVLLTRDEWLEKKTLN